MNPTFGASILSWIPPMWTPEGGLFAIQQASAAGFDLLEILLPCLLYTSPSPRDCS